MAKKDFPHVLGGGEGTEDVMKFGAKVGRRRLMPSTLSPPIPKPYGRTCFIRSQRARLVLLYL